MMNLFLKNVFYFLLVILIISSFSIILPPTPKTKSSHLFAKAYKDTLLVNTPSKRIIFVGGSNIAFGINSVLVKDSLSLNPINTGYNAGIGLIYMMENTLSKVKEGDIVIVSPEYQFFYGDGLYGDISLIITLFDIPNGLSTQISLINYLKMFEYLPQYVASKYKIANYFIDSNEAKGIYGRLSFNEYGDSYRHWNLENEIGSDYYELNEGFNHTAINELLEFKIDLENKGANLFITFPGINHTSYLNIEDDIDQVYEALKINEFKLIGEPSDFIYPDSLKFNSPYHPNRNGAIIRTVIFIKRYNSINP